MPSFVMEADQKSNLDFEVDMGFKAVPLTDGKASRAIDLPIGVPDRRGRQNRSKRTVLSQEHVFVPRSENIHGTRVYP